MHYKGHAIDYHIYIDPMRLLKKSDQFYSVIEAQKIDTNEVYAFILIASFTPKELIEMPFDEFAPILVANLKKGRFWLAEETANIFKMGAENERH